MSINDIQALLNPISDKYFQTNGEINLSTIYEEIFSHEKAQVDLLKEDIISKYETASKMMQGAPDEDKEMLQLFSFIGLLGFDVYIKKLLIEKIVDGYCNPPACNEKEKNPEKKKEKKSYRKADEDE